MNRPSQKLPDPWLFDNESRIRELDRIREIANQIPVTDANATHFGINLTVNAIWTLRENLRYLLHLHREGQRSFAKQSAEAQKPVKTARKTKSNIIGIRA